MVTIATLQRANHGTHFRAAALRDAAGLIDPFLGVDHAWMSAPTFPPHPHAGFSAVSYLFLDSETGIDNRDSLGTHNLIQPGGLHWAAAGRGIIHEENPAETGKTVHSLQIFVNLAREQQEAAPLVLSLKPQEVPVVRVNGATVRVPLGSFQGAISPISPPTDVRVLDISLDERGRVAVPVPTGHVAFVMPIFGVMAISGQEFSGNTLNVPVFPPQANEQTITLEAEQGNAKAVLFSGKPLAQPVYWQGPFAMASSEALTKTIKAYQSGELGSLQRI
ncbi:MAG TPA: pirin-like C-terminal cupin domain-containing protein [Candidatus Sulfotelmatobacter sp.]|jgi:redox-sensitive bicupin YhaK (pirin superfamily)|nr:pirin-like C-terminal cupin domain-containing protein [Candidatus Sulfotelmatobacter sp.]